MIVPGCLFGGCSFKRRGNGRSQKIETVKNYRRPSSVTEVRSFVGLASNYQRFVNNFASIAIHLTMLTQNETLESRFMKLGILENGGVLASIEVRPIFIEEIKAKQSEKTIQVLEDMLRTCVINFGGHWDKFLPLCEFSYNNNYHSSIDMTLFEALYERGCRSLIGWFEAGDVKPLGVDSVKDAHDKVMSIQARLPAA
ncbi:hypothetical protein MTR67_007522 [Solanum verrucosum]|uniref:Reverse transcriptase domain-containing protein n=1 Tax=Solanum verrucosum TaxID=315347 RepID=A0AAF0TAP3_SOLVR|nr:hypothetical protein MTR67_007522 [Solanum verrucosum]